MKCLSIYTDIGLYRRRSWNMGGGWSRLHCCDFQLSHDRSCCLHVRCCWVHHYDHRLLWLLRICQRQQITSIYRKICFCPMKVEPLIQLNFNFNWRKYIWKLCLFYQICSQWENWDIDDLLSVSRCVDLHLLSAVYICHPCHSLPIAGMSESDISMYFAMKRFTC